MAAFPNMVELIARKRDGGRLSATEIHWMITAYCDNRVAEEQMSAMCMAVYLRGLDADETIAWTDAYVASGTKMDWSDLSRPTTDKHSTGGVGDKITLPLTPLVAALGAAVPQLSGRGLGHTGGTLDKLESYRGFRATLTPAEMRSQLNTVGGVICAASDDLAPADRRIYALRDITATVASIPLIAASIMSKKIAEGTNSLVLDVKVGAGAFMRNLSDAQHLARTMVDLGTAAGVSTKAILTSMDAPLGFTAGNALEVTEALEVLQGAGPADVVALVEHFATTMLDAAGLDASDVPDALADGRAMDTWRRLIRAQGADPDAPLPSASIVETVSSSCGGTLASMDALAVGMAAWRLGAGRSRKEDPVDHAAGVRWFHKPGDVVRPGTPIFELHTNDPSRIEAAREALQDAVCFAESAAVRSPLILEEVG